MYKFCYIAYHVLYLPKRQLVATSTQATPETAVSLASRRWALDSFQSSLSLVSYIPYTICYMLYTIYHIIRYVVYSIWLLDLV